MITAEEARTNVERFNTENEEYRRNEQSIEEMIDIESKNGRNFITVILKNCKLRNKFIDEMINLGFECNYIQIANVPSLVIKWG